MKAKCLMLDVDGVLVFGRPTDGQHWMVGLSNDLGISPRDLVREFFRAEWNEVVVGKKELLPTLRDCLRNIAPDVSVETLIAYWFEMDSRIVQPVLLDVRKVRDRGVPVYLATNQDHSRADYLMHRMGLSDEVDGIVCSAVAGHKKPDIGFYSFAEEATGYSPDELIMVDDTLENVEAARASGWSAVHWTEGESLSKILQRNIG